MIHAHGHVKFIQLACFGKFMRFFACEPRFGQATRRFGVDTKWLQESGVLAAKDHMSVKDYLQIENQSEEKLDKVREAALRVG